MILTGPPEPPSSFIGATIAIAHCYEAWWAPESVANLPSPSRANEHPVSPAAAL